MSPDATPEIPSQTQPPGWAIMRLEKAIRGLDGDACCSRVTELGFVELGSRTTGWGSRGESGELRKPRVEILTEKPVEMSGR